jgi:hypothetical protein
MITVAVFVGAGSLAYGAANPVAVCKDKKYKAAGKKAASVLKAFGKNTKKTNTAKLAQDISKAQSKFTKAFTKADSPGSCPFTGDAGHVEQTVDGCVNEVIRLIAFGTTTTSTTTTTTASTTTTITLPLCGLPVTGQTTCWDSSGTVIPCAGTGHDGDIQAGCTLSYTDNGDGTVIDNCTGLMWEKKSDDDSINDKDNTYSWDNAFAVHVAGLNGASFAGYDDWRVPNARELQSIVNFEVWSPSVSPAFNTACVPGCTVAMCSCTASSLYWSSTTNASAPAYAWFVRFSDGLMHGSNQEKSYEAYVRAVRGGLPSSPSAAFLDATSGVLD